MLRGDGVGRRITGARAPAWQGVLSLLTPSLSVGGFRYQSLNISPGFRPFLTGSAPQTEFDVTYSKQTLKKILTGARTHIKRSVFPQRFSGAFSTEHFPAHRRISLQESIARVSPVADQARMQFLAGRL